MFFNIENIELNKKHPSNIKYVRTSSYVGEDDISLTVCYAELIMNCIKTLSIIIWVSVNTIVAQTTTVTAHDLAGIRIIMKKTGLQKLIHGVVLAGISH